MTTPAITINCESTVVRAARRLSHHDIQRLPVTDADGRLAGIVSRKDLLTVFLRPDDTRELEVSLDTSEGTAENGTVRWCS